MIVRGNGRSIECVLVDLNTQRDFCERDGAFPVHNAAPLIAQLRRVIAWARRNQAPVISSVEAHRPFELSDSGNPICCVDGSCGQRKLEFTLLPLRAWIEADNTLSVPIDLFSQVQQVIFQKRTDDLLGNPKADRLLGQLPVDEYILFGTGLECSVKALALALLARGKRATIVVDACGYWSRSTADLAVRQIEAKGAQLINVDDLRGRHLDRTYRYPRFEPPPRTNGHARIANPIVPPGLNGKSTAPHLQAEPPANTLRNRNGHSRPKGM